MSATINLNKPKITKSLEMERSSEFIEKESKINVELPAVNHEALEIASDDQTLENKSKLHPGRAIILFVLVLLVVIAGIMHGWHGRKKKDYIIIAQYEMVSRLDVETGALKSLIEEEGITAVEFDNNKNCTFWHNRHSYTIKRKCFPKEGKDLVAGIKKRTSLAYDWISETLYFTHGNKIKFVINNEVYDNEIKRVRIIHTDGDDPNKWEHNNLIVHPVMGYLFWIKRLIGTNRGMIKRVELDGTDPNILIEETDIKALHLDYRANRLHWLHPTNNSSRSGDLNGGKEKPEKKWRGLLSYSDRYCWPSPKNCMNEILYF